jgi:inositol-hexakisphosphate 5-kinase
VEDPAEQEAKRRRIMYIAEECLKGNRPILLTARLKGPFNNGWQNPWMKVPVPEKHEGGLTKNLDENINDENAEPPAKKQRRAHERKTRFRRRDPTGAPASTTASRTASPETSRAPDIYEELQESDPIPSQISDIRSSATEPFDSSVADQFIQNRPISSNPFWLHRPQTTPESKRNIWNDVPNDLSPVQRRSKGAPRPIPQFAPRQIGSPVQEDVFATMGLSPVDEDMTCGSESMMISSGNTIKDHNTPLITERAVASQSARKAKSSRKAVEPERERGTSLPLFPTQKNEVDVQSNPRRLRHNLVASLSPVPPGSFIYRKRIQPERNNTKEVEPATTVVYDDPLPVEPSLLDEDMPATSPGNIRVEEQDEVQEERPKSPPETYPTQAAMLLAQIEFQEANFSMISSIDSPTAWTQSSEDTARPEPSPAITPASAFRIPPSRSFVSNRSIKGPPMSTQDLFGAASPFAFSTGKKSNSFLRQSLRSIEARSTTKALTKLGDTAEQSPTPSAGRVPLRPKNTATSPRSIAPSKTSLGPQSSAIDPWPRRSSDVELLPQLDFQKSLDGTVLNGHGEFTDQFFI